MVNWTFRNCLVYNYNYKKKMEDVKGFKFLPVIDNLQVCQFFASGE